MSSPGWAECAVKTVGGGAVKRVVDGETLKLSDGRLVRLAGIKIASPFGFSRYRGKHQKLRRKALFTVQKLIGSQAVTLGFGGDRQRRQDRYGRYRANVFVDDTNGPIWVQKRLVAMGLARVYGLLGNVPCIRALQKTEQGARAQRRGLWGLKDYAVLKSTPASKLYRHLNRYQLVEGKVFKVAKVRKRIFINFDGDWRRDFTALIATKHARRFSKAGMDVLTLTGRRVRIRGWLENWNGPLIRVTRPEQIEILEPDPLPAPSPTLPNSAAVIEPATAAEK